MYSWNDWNNVQQKEMCVQERFGFEKYIDYNWRVVGASGTVCEDQKLLLSCSMCWIWNAKVGALPRMPKPPCIIGHVSSEVCHAVVRSENCLTQTSTKADILDVPQDLPLHFPRRQTQTGIPKVKLEDQTLGPTQTLKMTQRKSHWLLSCDSSESMLNYSLTNIGVLPEKDKRGIHRHAICCQKKSTWGWYPPWPEAIQYWMMILDVLKPVWNSGGSTKIKRWNFWQTQRHLDYYSWALQVCQAPVECRRWDNEGRAWSHSSESAASKHTYRFGPRGIFRSR